MNFKKTNIITGWIVFAIAATVYILSIESSASFWDCGEFIATAVNMEIGHPPGAPLFMIIGKLFSLFAFGNHAAIPRTINVMSALASGFTIMFLFWSITHLARKVFQSGESLKKGQTLAVIGAGLAGALAYTFTDSFWFSAVEAEVYAMSSLFTAVVFWSILKWESVADEPGANRWLILIGYLMGLSIGVHILNLLALPAIVLVYYYKKYRFSVKGILTALFVSVVLLALILYGVIQGTLKIASIFELFFVNVVGLPFNFGVLIFLAILVALLVYAIYRTHRKNNVLWNTIFLIFTFIMIGYSSIMILAIRSGANPPLDENNPDNTLSLLSYVNREVYGQRPLLYGEYFNAPVENYKEGKKAYDKENGKYIVADTRTKYIYDKRFTTFFPRMYNSLDPKYANAYKQWGRIKGRPVRVDKNGKTETINCPTFVENMRFFFRYQLGHMYFRYFMWNFAGRQNDIQGFGDVQNGNWITGIKFLDAARLGPQDHIPASTKNNKGHNKYYALPLLLGLIGAWYYYKKERKNFWVITLLFVMTGMAIIVYLNEVPQTPRERDYVYVGSFYAFAMFIGIGVLYLYELLSKWLNGTVSAIISTVAALALVPAIMASENWDDHNRSGRYTAHDFAYDYLIGLDPNALLFTNGDNDTFPLWYIQEVEKVRTDVRVCCMPFMPQDWYIDQLKRTYYESKALPISLTHKQYRQGQRGYIPIVERVKQPVNLKEAVDFVANDDPKTMIGTSSGRQFHYFPTATFILPVDSAKVVSNGTVSPARAGEIVPQIQWRFIPEGQTQGAMYKDQFIILDILAYNNWERPMYYTTPGQSGSVKLDEYLELDGLSYRLIPVKGERQMATRGMVNTGILYNNLMHKFKYTNFNNPKVYQDETCRRMMQNMKNNFIRLADQLIRINQPDSARDVLNKLEEVMPINVIGYTLQDLKEVDLRYTLGDTTEARALMEHCYNAITDNINYYTSLPDRWIPSVSNDIQNTLGYELPSLMTTAKQYNEDEWYKKLEEKYNQAYNNFMNKLGQ
ncbi:MAG: DUF2723 domain-containing protein [Bacteroidales bacterium]|nr:DUF2723 domain-containing protein [Bacteroidales bacterium]